MKKNENKSLVRIAIVLIALIIIGNILNMRGSAVEEKVEEPKGKLTHITVWLTENNGKDWDDARTEIEEAIMEEYGTFETELIHVHNDETRVYWIEITYEADGAIVTGKIVDHR